MFYGAVVWDPWLILSQIVCLQCLYYLTLGLFMFILVGTRVSGLSLIYFFDYSTLTASTVTGWCVIGSFMLSALAGAFYVFYLVERAKKCLDFSATICIIHLFICIIYGGWPSSITWWVVSGTSLAVMALLGEWLCIRREMREIPITQYRSRMDEEGKYMHWSPAMDRCLIETLLDQVREGNKCPNGFKPIAYTAAINALNERFSSHLCRQHIINRLKTLKSTHRKVLDLIGKSGIGWNDKTKMLDVSEEQWKEFIKKNPDIDKKLHKKRFELFDEMCEVFGADHATGEWARSRKISKDG